jgi:very-short-patch-repair endonuclease
VVGGEVDMQVHNKKSLEEIRRQLRKDSTPAETFMWQQLRGSKLNGLKFKRQHSIGNYIVDFYCASLRLIIEADGSVHNSSDQKEKDKFRDENLKDMGFTILRFPNEEILYNISNVKKEILNVQLNYNSSPLLLQGEGLGERSV